MKIYFAYTIRGDRSKLEQGKEIVKLLQKKGHSVLTTHVFEDDVAEKDGRLEPEKIFDRDLKWLKEADVVIADASGSSFGVGFEVGFSLEGLDKKVFLVYDAKLKNNLSRIATGMTHKNCTKFEYTNFEELRDFINKHF